MPRPPREDSGATESPNHAKDSRKNAGDLVIEPVSGNGESGAFAVEVERTLSRTESEVILGQPELSSEEVHAWRTATGIVKQLQPVPWFIWRLSNFVFAGTRSNTRISEGFVLGLRRLLFAAASDPLLGKGEKVNNMRVALDVLAPDVIAAVSIIHAVCRKLSSRGLERIWRPILDDALLRARLGFWVGCEEKSFGSGRGMLAGFSGRGGLAILLATGTPEQAKLALELLASGEEIGSVGYEVYQCHPVQVSAMLLSICGVGCDAAFGTAAYVANQGPQRLSSHEQKQWLSTFTIIELVRTNRIDSISEDDWAILGHTEAAARKELKDEALKAIRRGHGWSWLS